LVVSTCFNCDLCFIPTLWQPQIFTFDLCSIHFHTKDFKIFQLWSMVPDFGLKHIETTNWWIQTCFYVQLVGVLDWNRDVRVRKPAPFAKAWAEVFSVWCRNGTSTPLGPICVYKIILVLYYCIIYIHIYIYRIFDYTNICFTHRHTRTRTPASFRRRAGAAYAAHHAPKLQVPWELTLVELKSLDNCRKQNTTGIWYQ
jgi:hypothetical protein